MLDSLDSRILERLPTNSSARLVRSGDKLIPERCRSLDFSHKCKKRSFRSRSGPCSLEKAYGLTSPEAKEVVGALIDSLMDEGKEILGALPEPALIDLLTYERKAILGVPPELPGSLDGILDGSVELNPELTVGYYDFDGFQRTDGPMKATHYMLSAYGRAEGVARAWGTNEDLHRIRKDALSVLEARFLYAEIAEFAGERGLGKIEVEALKREARVAEAVGNRISGMLDAAENEGRLPYFPPGVLKRYGLFSQAMRMAGIPPETGRAVACYRIAAEIAEASGNGDARVELLRGLVGRAASISIDESRASREFWVAAAIFARRYGMEAEQKRIIEQASASLSPSGGIQPLVQKALLSAEAGNLELVAGYALGAINAYRKLGRKGRRGECAHMSQLCRLVCHKKIDVDGGTLHFGPPSDYGHYAAEVEAKGKVIFCKEPRIPQLSEMGLGEKERKLLLSASKLAGRLSLGGESPGYSGAVHKEPSRILSPPPPKTPPPRKVPAHQPGGSGHYPRQRAPPPLGAPGEWRYSGISPPSYEGPSYGD